MSILDLNLNEDLSPTPLNEGEQKLRIAGAEERENKNGNAFILVTFESIDNPDADNVFDNLYLPKPEDKPSASKFKRRLIQKLVQAYDVPLTKSGGVDVDKMPGCSGFSIIKHERQESGDIRAVIQEHSVGA